MAYPFPKTEREVYAKTFLKDVELAFAFPNIDMSNVSREELLHFYDKAFNLSIAPERLADGITVRDNDDQFIFGFDSNRVSLKMKFPSYKSFDLALLWFPILYNYLRVLKVECISEIIIRKYNELKYNLPSNKMDVVPAMRMIFSPDLLEYGYEEGDSFDSQASKFQELARWEKRTFMEDEETKSAVVIEYGFSQKDSQKGIGVLTMNSIVESHDMIQVDEALLRASVQSMNLILDQAFNWSVTEGIKNQMRAK